MYDTLPIVGTLFISALTLVSTVLFAPVYERVTVLGLLRHRASIENIHGSNSTVFPVAAVAGAGGDGVSQKPLHDRKESIYIIPETPLCEDMHFHAASGLVFAACQEGTWDSASDERAAWYPPVVAFKDPKSLGHGKIVVIDPATMKARNLALEGFKSRPWVSHGIDIVDSPTEKDTIYLFAVNHLPNPEYYTEPPPDPKVAPPKARSQIEVFKHVLHSDKATHVRSIVNPLIATPNDIYAVSPTSLYITNDHTYRDESLMRAFEDIAGQYAGPYSNIVHVSITDLHASDATAGVLTSVAISGLHNPNGLGHPSSHRNGKEVLSTDAAGGMLLRSEIGTSAEGTTTTTTNLNNLEIIQLKSTLDNPSYYEDPYASPQSNASGYILAGLARAVDILSYSKDGPPQPSLVWHVRSNNEDEAKHAGWEQNLIFQDDGRKMNTATTAVMVPRDPKDEGGVKKAWLFVTGVMSKGIGVVGVDL